MHTERALENDLKKRLRNKFLQIFGSSWAMPQEMKLRYEYARWMTIELYLVPDRNAALSKFCGVPIWRKNSRFSQEI